MLKQDPLFPDSLHELEIHTTHLFYGYNITSEPTANIDIHCHTFYEIYYLLSGNVQYIVENNIFTPPPHSIIIIPPQVQHGVKVLSSAPYKRISLHFLPDIISEPHRKSLLSLYPACMPCQSHEVYFENVDYHNISPFLRAIYDCNVLDSKHQEEILSIYVEALLARLSFISRSNLENEAEKSPADAVSRIIFYLNSNLSSNISLDILSEKFNISKHHINKVFKKATGTTIFDYLKRKRIIAAQKLLNNGVNALEVCNTVGYSDYSAFFRAYRQITGHPPREDKNILPL